MLHLAGCWHTRQPGNRATAVLGFGWKVKGREVGGRGVKVEGEGRWGVRLEGEWKGGGGG